jgi:TetR/AcrR family transcriptional regulator, transcriptional repressor for nem operon
MPRPRHFDEQDVVDRAMELFWTEGYEATSVTDLTAQLGVHSGSLYRTFGDEHALFVRALGRYRETQAIPLAPASPTGGRCCRGSAPCCWASPSWQRSRKGQGVPGG